MTMSQDSHLRIRLWAKVEMGLKKERGVVRASCQERRHPDGLEPADAAGPLSGSPLKCPRGLTLQGLESDRDGRSGIVLGSRNPFN